MSDLAATLDPRDWDPHDSSFRHDPMPWYHTLRERSPVHQHPDAFDDPDRFDIHRTDGRHLAFGKGIHFCVGAALGRLEGDVVIPAVLRRFPHLSLVDAEPTWRASFVTRQLATLPVSTSR